MIKRENIYNKRQNCPVCQSSEFLVLFSILAKTSEFLNFLKLEEFYSKIFWDDYKNGLLEDVIFEIVKCRKCSFTFQRETLNNEGMSLLYNQWLDKDKLLEYYANLKTDKSQQYLLKIIKNYFKNKSNINVMDYGAGYGNFCSLSINLGFNTYAFDLSDDKNNHLSSHLGIKIISDLTNFDSFFDFIFINQVFEHVQNPVEILKSLQKILTDEGIIFISVPNCRHLEETIKNQGLSNELFMQLSPQQHINAFNNKTLALLGRKSGLKEFNIVDFLKLYNRSLSKDEIKLLLKATIKSAIGSGTSLFFRKDE